ncbi:oligosaccharyl transferase, archaeosortase A system-associated [Haloparvum sedimenti]|uniref:oligosaccharyl transferase, archaeosortase A system-associated n=1 Tax=Haloparvum sedimenti TaxID=1678448 RepID=UPI0009B5BB5E|nr:oligosaccharyl transferase, archaeosortase A system-associated [Haloparvum sedimenti]
MSQASDPPDESGDSVLDLLERWYHVPALAAFLVLMLWSRLRSYGEFVRDGEAFFSGNDAWYHSRTTQYTVENFPGTIPYEVWTGFPYGTQVGVFGTLYDLITATLILVTSPVLGDDASTVLMLVMPTLFAAATGLLTYFLAKRFVGKFGAVAAVGILALFSGTFFNYTTVGFYDHHAAEVFFQTLAVLTFLAVFGVAAREKPVWELVVDRDSEALKKPLAYAAAAGLALALYMYTWQPGVMMVGFTGIFLVVKITSDVVHGESPEPTAFVGAVAMGVTGLLMLVPLNTFGFSATNYSLLQVVLPLGVAVGSVFLAYLAREWEARDLDATTYPAAVGGLIALSVGVLAVAVPSFWNTLYSNVLRTLGFSTSATARTIGEAQPPLARYGFGEFVVSEYGLAFFLALFAVLYILARPLIKSDDVRDTGYVAAAFVVIGSVYALPQVYGFVGGLVGVGWQVVGLVIAAAFLVGATYRARYDVEELYFLVWAAFIASAAFTQMRFNYYLAVIVAVGAAYFLQLALDALDLREQPVDELVGDIQGWQVLTAAAVVLVLVAPLLFMVTPVWAAGAQNGPGGVVQWDDSLQWMNDETPHPGELEGADNPMEFYGSYERPEDGDFDYPEGAYGVQSWWDYGHWITTRAERIPNANPFQQNAAEAANFLLAPSEEDASDVLASQSDEGENTRYVMVDWQMVDANSKFGAPVTFYNDEGESLERDELVTPLRQVQEGQFLPAIRLGNQYNDLYVKDQRYYESLMVHLYEFHGSATSAQPVVVDWEETPAQTQSGEEVTVETLPQGDQPAVRTFDNMSAARAYVEEDGSAQVGGVGGFPSEDLEALEHYRLVHANQQPAFRRTLQRQQVAQALGIPGSALSTTTQSWVKTFERVPGATVEGSGAEPGEEVTATVEMGMPNSNETFTYTQRATANEDGEFEFTLPYSTTGYAEYGPENGYTNTSVRAEGSYRIFDEGEVLDNGTTVQNRAEVEVHEGTVVGDDDEPVTVTLEEERTEPEGSGGNETDDGNTTNESSLSGTAFEDSLTAANGDGDAGTFEAVTAPRSATLAAEP